MIHYATSGNLPIRDRAKLFSFWGEKENKYLIYASQVMAEFLSSSSGGRAGDRTLQELSTMEALGCKDWAE